MALKILDVLHSRSTNIYKGNLVDEDGNAIAGGSLTTAVVTLADQATGSVINGRNSQNILNANNVTIDAAGLIQWELQVADVTPTTTSPAVVHEATFVITYGANRQLTKKVGFRMVVDN